MSARTIIDGVLSGGVGGWRGTRFTPEFVYSSVCLRNDGQPASSPVPSAPPRTVLTSFQVHGSPAAGFREVSSRHLAYLTPYSGPPAPLRLVSNFLGPRLLRGLRRHGARAR